MMMAKISLISYFQLPKKIPNITKITVVAHKFQKVVILNNSEEA